MPSYGWALPFGNESPLLFTLPLLVPSVALLQGGDRGTPALPLTHTRIPLPSPFQGAVPYLHSARPLLWTRRGVCALPSPPPPPQSLAVFLVLCTVQAPWGCWTVVTPWFHSTPHLRSQRVALVFPASWGTSYLSPTRSRSIWGCSMTSDNSFPSYIYALDSLLMFVLFRGSCLNGSLFQMHTPIKNASRRKIPSNKPFPVGPIFAFAPRSPPPQLHFFFLIPIKKIAPVEQSVNNKHLYVLERDWMKI
jgi:hypothetical protein